ncbi:MAG TPA: amidohydrolase family protein, partial [Kofleriaceae bacterium]
MLVALVACHAPPAMTPPTPPTSSVAVQPGDIVISHVTVVPMTGDRELPDHSVVIRGERIAAVAPAEQIAAPAGGQVQVIDGTGRWLMPGLADMRVRLGEQRELGLYVAAGVTTVRDLSGDGGHLEWRDQAARGELVGPTIVIADPAAADPGTWRCPALVASDRRAALGEPDALKRRVKWLGTVRPVAVRAWLANPGTPEAIAAAAEEHAGAVRALAALAADAPILMGTDTGRPFVIAGASAHEELERMIQAGLPRPRVLQIATAEAARFLGTPGELGVVAAGARADLLLLASDPNTAPLPDVPDGVMLRGRWHARADLDGLLAEIASASH